MMNVFSQFHFLNSRDYLFVSFSRYTAWGEYPLGFAACLGQEECVRLLVAKGADPNLQDTNGNTVLHMLVIHDKKVMMTITITITMTNDL